jgi:Tfp pilus assembly protein PilO
MNKLKNLSLQLLPWLILAYNGYMFYEKYVEHQAQVESTAAQEEAILDKIRVAEQKIKKANQFKDNLEKSKERVLKVNEQIVKVQKQLPTDVNDTQVLEMLDKESKNLNLQSPEVKPSGEQMEGFYLSQRYSYKAQGTYLQFMIFFEKLMQTERLFNVKRMRMSSETLVQKGRFTLIQGEALIETYKYNQNYQEKSGVDEIEAQFKI